MSYKGRFIVLEALDTDIIRRAIRELENKLPPSKVVFTSEPNGTLLHAHQQGLMGSHDWEKLGALAKFNYYWAARAHHVEDLIRPALEEGKHVICSRFDSSTFANQLFGDGGHELRFLFTQLREICLRGAFPTRYIYIDESPEKAAQLKRLDAMNRGKDSSTVPDTEYLARVQKGYLEFMTAMVPSHIVTTEKKSDLEIIEETLMLVGNNLA